MRLMRLPPSLPLLPWQQQGCAHEVQGLQGGAAVLAKLYDQTAAQLQMTVQAVSPTVIDHVAIELMCRCHAKHWSHLVLTDQFD